MENPQHPYSDSNNEIEQVTRRAQENILKGNLNPNVRAPTA